MQVLLGCVCSLVATSHPPHRAVPRRPHLAPPLTHPPACPLGFAALAALAAPPPPADGAPELRTLLCIGGVDMKQQADVIRNSGIHMVVATPGRLKDMLT